MTFILYNFFHLSIIWNKENTEGAIKHEQSKETGNTGHTRGRNTTQCVLDTTILQTISTGLLSNPSTQVFMIKFINFSNLSEYSLIFPISIFIDFLLLCFSLIIIDTEVPNLSGVFWYCWKETKIPELQCVYSN
jgi:hypothetical protein